MHNSENQAIKFFKFMEDLSQCCMLIKIVNYDEIIANSENAMQAINVVEEIIKIKFKELKVAFDFCSTNNKIFLKFPIADQDDFSMRSLAFDIYSRLQLYIDENFPKLHINVSISSLNFPEDCQDSSQIANILFCMLVNNYPYRYYQNYHDAKANLLISERVDSELASLKQALNDNTIKFAYQPIVDRRTGEVPYYECLLRILDRNNELVSIGPYISSAESRGLINVIDILALDMAINELINDNKISLSVNISNCGILDEYLLQKAEDLLKIHDVADRLIIEVTETILNVDFEKTKKFMNRLHSYGCRFALDDFGSGFTSFKQLQHLPIDIVKIDGSYIKNITSNHQSKYFVETLVKISEDLGIKTVAEFVENGEIAKFLIDIKVDGMQGNFFSPASSNKVS